MQRSRLSGDGTIIGIRRLQANITIDPRASHCGSPSWLFCGKAAVNILVIGTWVFAIARLHAAIIRIHDSLDPLGGLASMYIDDLDTPVLVIDPTH